MSERERQREADERGGEDADLEAPVDDVPEVERSAESFLELEAEIGGDAEPIASPRYGRIVDASRVDADTVPEDYPRPVKTETALALELELDGRTATAFFEWPDGDDDHLERLLSVADLSYEQFGDLHGRRVLVAPEEGYLVPVVPDSAARGDDRGLYGVLAGFAFNLLTLLVLVVSPATLATSLFVLLFAFVNLFLLPASTFADARYLASRTDWDHGPMFWAFVVAFPLVNVPAILAYLYTRRGARKLLD